MTAGRVAAVPAQHRLDVVLEIEAPRGGRVGGRNGDVQGFTINVRDDGGPAVSDGADDAGVRNGGHLGVEGTEAGVARTVHEPAVGGAAVDQQSVHGGGATQLHCGGIDRRFDVLSVDGGAQQQQTDDGGAAECIHGGTASRAKPTGGRAGA